MLRITKVARDCRMSARLVLLYLRRVLVRVLGGHLLLLLVLLLKRSFKLGLGELLLLELWRYLNLQLRMGLLLMVPAFPRRIRRDVFLRRDRSNGGVVLAVLFLVLEMQIPFLSRNKIRVSILLSLERRRLRRRILVLPVGRRMVKRNLGYTCADGGRRRRLAYTP